MVHGMMVPDSGGFPCRYELQRYNKATTTAPAATSSVNDTGFLFGTRAVATGTQPPIHTHRLVAVGIRQVTDVVDQLRAGLHLVLEAVCGVLRPAVAEDGCVM